MKNKKKSRSHDKKITNNKQSHHKLGIKKKKVKVVNAPPEDYFIINGNIYEAGTHSERDQYHGYLHSLKVQSKFRTSSEPLKLKKKSLDNHNHGYWMETLKQDKEQTERQESTIHERPLPLEDYVRNMTPKQKIQMLRQLQKQIKDNPQQRCYVQNPTIQVSQIQTHKNYKLKKLEEKLKTLKTQLLLKWEAQVQKIDMLFGRGQISRQDHKEKLLLADKMKENKLKIIQCTKTLFQKVLDDTDQKCGFQEILKNLNSFSSFDQIPLGEVDSARHTDSHSNSIKSEAQFDKVSQSIDFQQEVKNQSNSEEVSNIRIITEESLLISPESPEKKDQFQCNQPMSKKLKIPLLMTREKVQEIEADRKAKQVVKVRQQLEKRLAFQMSQIDDNENCFTTLAGINSYIMGLYQFIMRTDLDKIVERLNFPFGKSVRDKLCSLQQNGQIDEFEVYPVLDEHIYTDFNKEIALNMRRLGDQQKIHNKAVFECFNTNLNAYRPYFELEGEVYPWAVSQKGITFYQINEENIEEVFEKTKIKVLQFSSSLCGIIPNFPIQQSPPEILKQKREELQIKEQKISIMEEYTKWDIKVVNMEAFVRLTLSQDIFEREIIQCVKQIQVFK